MFFKTLVIIVAASTVFAGCKGQNRYLGTSSSSSLAPPPPPSTIATGVTYQTTDTVIAATTTAKTLTWDLGTQLVKPDKSVANPLPGGGTLTISVQIVTSPTGEEAYQFTNPKITGGSSAIQVQAIGFNLNGVFQSNATTYSTLDRFIPASPNSRTLSGTAEVIVPGNGTPVNPAATDTIAITFALLKPTVFNPPTYTALKSATGVFGMSCLGCHSAGSPAAGLDLTNYTYLTSHYEAVPFQPSNSKIIDRMTNASGQGFMPSSGELSAGSIQMVNDWILDGAPNN